MLVILIGPKGSGKTFIGKILQRRLGVQFIHVEAIWMDHIKSCEQNDISSCIMEGLRRLDPVVDDVMSVSEHATIETTAATTELRDFIVRVSQRHPTILCRIHAPLETCLERIKTRDHTEHLEVDEMTIYEVFELSESLDLEYDLELVNDSLDEDRIVAEFEPLIKMLV